MSEPPSPTVGAGHIQVVGADEQSDVEVDVDRWRRLAAAVLAEEGRHGELTLIFVDAGEIAELNRRHLDGRGPTDVLSFPLDAVAPETFGGPVLLGDVLVCPAVAAAQASTHAGTLDDELALLVVHGVLHVLGHDHAEPGEAAAMRRREIDLLEAHHWGGPAPVRFSQEHGAP